MRYFLYTMVSVVLVFSGQLQAGFLELRYEGVLADGSYDPSGGNLNGMPFQVSAYFDSVPIDTIPGGGAYLVSNVTAIVNGMTYLETDPSYFLVTIFDPSSEFPFTGVFLPVLAGDTAFAPVFAAATPAISGESASPTVFSDYLGSVDSMIDILTADGFLLLVYDQDAGVSATIIGVPEPSTAILVLMGACGSMAVGRWRKRTFSDVA